MNCGIEEEYRNTAASVLKRPASSSEISNLFRKRKPIVKKRNAVALAKVSVGSISKGGWKGAVPIRLYLLRGQNGVKVGELRYMKNASLQLASYVIERISFWANEFCSLHHM